MMVFVLSASMLTNLLVRSTPYRNSLGYGPKVWRAMVS